MLKSLLKIFSPNKKTIVLPSDKSFPIPDLPEHKSFGTMTRDVIDVLRDKVLASDKFSQLTEADRRVYIQLVIDSSKNAVKFQKIIDILADDNL